jgi:hypothetical protein
MDEVYENSKYTNYVYLSNYKNLINIDNGIVSPVSYVTILDNFCASYEEGHNYNDPLVNYGTNLYVNTPELVLNNELRLSNPLKLRNTAKSSIVTFNAIQKVFRSRLDEGRSNARLQDFSNSFMPHPFLTDKRVSYESLLGKNKENFFNINLFLHNTKQNINSIYSLVNSLNTYFIDLPFLVSMKSDPSRYLWFDWQAK